MIRNGGYKLLPEWSYELKYNEKSKKELELREHNTAR